MAAKRICSVSGCGKKHLAKGFCNAHYLRLKKFGDALHPVKPCQTFFDKHVGYQGNKCVIWPYHISKAGYPRLGSTGTAHRLMCEATHGQRPSEEYQAAHDCGNRSCINPQHIRWKTPVENAFDRVIHGTHQFGEQIHTAKLSVAQVAEIRMSKGDRQSDLADRYGISQTNVSAIIRRETWKMC
jgi:hypothetical protein